jgi:hypothetical protein
MLRIEDKKLKEMKWEAARLDGTHDKLVSSLHRMLDPKVMFARERFEKKELMFEKEEEAAKAWKERRDQLKDSAMALIKQKKTQHESLLAAEEEVKEARRKEQMARAKYESNRQQTAEKVQSYRYAETRFKAEEQHEKAAKETALAARESVAKLHRVFEVEEAKVHQSMSYRKQKLDRKIAEVEAARQANLQKIQELKQQYKNWQDEQRERTAAVVEKREDAAAASEAFAARQQQVLDAASVRVARDAEAADDWDSWGGGFTKATDEVDD